MKQEKEQSPSSDPGPLMRDAPTVEIRRARSATRDQVASTPEPKGASIVRADLRTRPDSRAIPEAGSSPVPPIYAIEREAIRLRRLRIKQIEARAAKGTTVPDLPPDLIPYTRPADAEAMQKPNEKSFIQRLTKLFWSE